jgi:hypothetical protein
MSQKPATQPAARQSTIAVFAPSIPRPAPWYNDGGVVFNHDRKMMCLLMPNTPDEPKRFMLAAGDTAWQRDELLEALKGILATVPGLEGAAVESARALLSELDKDAT